MASDWPTGSGEMAQRIRAFDWATSPFGSPESWPQSLRTVVELMIASRFPMFVAWGPELAFLYNDSYAEILGRKHPRALGSPFIDIWSDIWTDIKPFIDSALAGKATWIENLPLTMNRHGHDEETYFTFSYSPMRDDNGEIAGMYCAVAETTGHVRAEATLRESEERQAFLLTLADDLSRLADPDEIMEVLAAHVGTRLNLSTSVFADVDEERSLVIVHQGWNAEGIPSLKQKFRMADYLTEDFQRAGRANEPMIVSDATTDPRVDTEAYARLKVGAFVIVPFHRDGAWTAFFAASDSKPRNWTSGDIVLFREICDRVFPRIERARAEASLRESEERFQQFADASSGGLWIRDADSLAMEYTSRAIGTIYGVEPAALLGPPERWAALIVPEDRDVALTHLKRAQQGEAVVHEFRIQRPSDLTFRWIRDTDFPLSGNGHVERIGGIAEDVTEAKRLGEHQRVLLAELQHRVRNIMGILRSMANRTADGAGTVEEYRGMLEGRLLAVARVQALLTREANAGGSLRSVLETEIGAQSHRDGQAELTGPDIMLSPKAVEVLTLAFHELATNALKYGALSAPGGRLFVRWAPFDKRGAQWLGIDWVEEGAPPRETSTRRGFGSELIEARIPYELGGSGRVSIEPGGARCHLEFPLHQAESILQTDAPAATTIFGGTLDMTGAPDLTGQRVLVVEDDYYIAYDTAAALRGAGAEVLGPMPREEATLELLETETPTAAVVDLNLGGGGPQFGVAHALRHRGIPFVFLTGYDPDMIPEDLADIRRLQKPLPLRDIVEAVSKIA